MCLVLRVWIGNMAWVRDRWRTFMNTVTGSQKAGIIELVESAVSVSRGAVRHGALVWISGYHGGHC
jgi:hypothetical protein